MRAGSGLVALADHDVLDLELVGRRAVGDLDLWLRTHPQDGRARSKRTSAARARVRASASTSSCGIAPERADREHVVLQPPGAAQHPVDEQVVDVAAVGEHPAPREVGRDDPRAVGVAEQDVVVLAEEAHGRGRRRVRPRAVRDVVVARRAAIRSRRSKTALQLRQPGPLLAVHHGRRPEGAQVAQRRGCSSDGASSSVEARRPERAAPALPEHAARRELVRRARTRARRWRAPRASSPSAGRDLARGQRPVAQRATRRRAPARA